MNRSHSIIELVLLVSIGYGQTAMAQVSPDGTVGTIVSPGPVFNITGGTRPSNSPNLFHSFSQFSLPTGSSAIFQNDPAVQNIFSRVTGGNRSDINGLIQTQGNASLFLMNPNGILFGPNAQLQIGGAFVGTTANSIKFSDGVEFSTVNPLAKPLLTVNVPIGLQMGTNSGNITVQGTGHRIKSGLFRPSDRSNNPIGLQVGIGQTLALIGNEVNVSGGIVATDGGHLEVGSVSQGQVRFNASGTRWVGDYSGVSKFADIHLSQQSSLDASGQGGSLQLQGRNLSLRDGSMVLNQNLGSESSGSMTIQATESLVFTGNTADGRRGSFVQSDNLGLGRAGDIIVSADQLLIQDGGGILTQTFTQGLGSNIIINATGTIEANGFSPAAQNSIISTSTINSGNAGDVIISASNLRLLNGGFSGSSSIATGQSGTVQVNIKDLIEISGNNSIILSPSALSSNVGNEGNANSVVINTAKLVVRNGGLLGSSTLAKGAAGSVIINASEFVEVSGRSVNSILPARIASTSEIVDSVTQAAFGIPRIPTGNAGSLTINTASLRITDGALVTVKNDGPGSAGNLKINANSILLDNQSRITASTTSGNGGDIILSLKKDLVLRHNSLISATAMGIGNGGNLSIHSPIIIGLENSDMIANAVQGSGGNIKITTQSIFGLQFRPQITPNNDITASSEFGINGNVQVNTIGINPTNALTSLPVNIADSSRQIADRCAAAKTGSFVSTGKGGIPQSPMQTRKSDRPWSDLRASEPARSVTTTGTNPVFAPIAQAPIIEAAALRSNPDGSIELVGENTSRPTDAIATCASAALP
jgi:filamentous hemagglutinin family protein